MEKLRGNWPQRSSDELFPFLFSSLSRIAAFAPSMSEFLKKMENRGGRPHPRCISNSTMARNRHAVSQNTSCTGWKDTTSSVYCMHYPGYKLKGHSILLSEYPQAQYKWSVCMTKLMKTCLLTQGGSTVRTRQFKVFKVYKPPRRFSEANTCLRFVDLLCS